MFDVFILGFFSYMHELINSAFLEDEEEKPLAKETYGFGDTVDVQSRGRIKNGQLDVYITIDRFLSNRIEVPIVTE